MSRNKRKSDKVLFAGVMLVSIIAVVAVGAYVKFAPADEVVNIEEPEEVIVVGGVQLLLPFYEDGQLMFERTEKELPEGTDVRVYTINYYLRNVNAVPEDVEVVTCTIKDSIATLDFNAAFARDYGTEDEMILINGMLSTMGQFEDVSFVKITVEGQEIETIGNLDLTELLRVIRLDPIERTGP